MVHTSNTDTTDNDCVAAVDVTNFTGVADITVVVFLISDVTTVDNFAVVFGVDVFISMSYYNYGIL